MNKMRLMETISQVLSRIFSKLAIKHYSKENLQPKYRVAFKNNGQIIGCKCEISKNRIVFCFFHHPITEEEYQRIEYRHDFTQKQQIIIPRNVAPLFEQMLTEVIDKHPIEMQQYPHVV